MSASKSEEAWPLFDIKDLTKRARDLRESIMPLVNIMSLSRELNEEKGMTLSNDQIGIMGDIMRYAIDEIFDTIESLEAINSISNSSESYKKSIG